jgi:ribose 1,5-bisphosphokinase PhnN
MKKHLAALAGSLSIAAHAQIPELNYLCPGNLEVQAHQGGPVFINGKRAKLRKFSDSYFEASRPGITISLLVNPDKSLSVSYTRTRQAHGICSAASFG